MTIPNEIRFHRDIKASPRQVFDLISKGQLLFATGILPGSLKLDFRAGGQFSFEWVSGGFCEGAFLNIDNPRSVSFSWTTRGCSHPSDVETKVEVNLEAANGGTKLTLVHSGFATAESRASHNGGWTESLDAFARGAARMEKFHDYSWNGFDLAINIRSTPVRLFQRWSTAEGLESFFIKKMVAKDAQKNMRARNEPVHAGDRYDWDWLHGNSSYGRILAVEKDKMISFTFGSCDVTVRFLPHEGGTWMQISQSRIPDFPEARVGLHVDCRSGWTYFATVLKALEEHGVDIRDKNPETAGSLAVGFEIPELRKAA